ncbi:unnamed protein product [Rotaria magnacalcarata]|uniref:MULE transposase domain-containing protein n=1 Tax=Rotaria magnacalcarata TaxID=392030 RepID=A0A817A4K8_9BILA|nr:unnamed protein product [Rotaria magnacalcarata]CAF4223366.1 unnamed protein product [Rotaria magnacalcarata]
MSIHYWHRYLYTRERQTEEKIIFRCKNRQCKGHCHTDPNMNIILSEPTEHCHGPIIDQVPVIKLKNKIKSRALTSKEPTSAIVYSELKSFPLDAAGLLPRTDTLQRTIRRQRQTPKTNPNNRLPDELRQTDRGDNFILHKDDNLIICCTTSNLSVLKTCKQWSANGTFKVCPDDFYQMFTLHGLFKSQVIPLVYGLLIGKRCLFHFGQCIWRNIQNHGLQKKYQEDKSFHLNIKKLIALAFVPVLDVIKAYESIVDDFEDDADEFLDYFEKTWIEERKKRGTGRKKQRFPVELWNVHDRVSQNLPHSNNSIEGCHNAFAQHVSITHPTINKSTAKIRTEQSKFEIDIAQIRLGHEPKSKKATYRKLDDRITRLVGDYGAVDLGEYLKNLAANVSI